MQDLIVLGLIPGTDTQLTFFGLLIIVLALLLVIAAIYELRSHYFRRRVEQIIFQLISL